MAAAPACSSSTIVRSHVGSFAETGVGIDDDGGVDLRGQVTRLLHELGERE